MSEADIEEMVREIATGSVRGLHEQVQEAVKKARQQRIPESAIREVLREWQRAIFGLGTTEMVTLPADWDAEGEWWERLHRLAAFNEDLVGELRICRGTAVKKVHVGGHREEVYICDLFLHATSEQLGRAGLLIEATCVFEIKTTTSVTGTTISEVGKLTDMELRVRALVDRFGVIDGDEWFHEFTLVDERTIRFAAWEVTPSYQIPHGDTRLLYGDDLNQEVTSPWRITPLIAGEVKWDGCSNTCYPRAEKVMEHNCFRDDLLYVGKMRVQVWDSCMTMLGVLGTADTEVLEDVQQLPMEDPPWRDNAKPKEDK